MLMITYFVPRIDVRLVYALVALSAAVVAFPVLTVVAPVAGACCVAVAPVLGQLAIGVVVIALVGWLTYPR